MWTARGSRVVGVTLSILILVVCLVTPSEQLIKKKLRLLFHGALIGGAVGGVAGYAIAKHHKPHHTVWVEKFHEPAWVVKEHGWHGGWDYGWHGGW